MTGNKQIVNPKRRVDAAWEGRINNDSLTPFEKELLEVIDSLEKEAEELRELVNNKIEANK